MNTINTLSTVDECLALLRSKGLAVAVHNDYRLKGKDYTFWLFTDSTGMSYKGEGITDVAALHEVLTAFNKHQSGNEQ